MTFCFFKESDLVGLVKEYPLAADTNKMQMYDIDGPPSEDGATTTGSSAFASTSLYFVIVERTNSRCCKAPSCLIGKNSCVSKYCLKIKPFLSYFEYT